MKKWLAILTAVWMLPASAMAEGTVTANAVAECRTVYQLTAPYSGTLCTFDWETGNVIAAGETLLEMETMKAVSPADGTVRALFAEPGDPAANVLGQYGMLAAIEKDLPMVVNASTDGAYSKDENKIVHVGEQVYLEEVNDRDNEGEGRIIAIQGKNYVVEVLEGAFEDNVSIEVFRSPGCESKTRIGSGRSDLTSEIPVTGAGVLVRNAVSVGDHVQKGDVLMELGGQDADSSLRSAAIIAPADGAVELSVISGMQVYKGQVLAKIHDLSAMNVVASVDEMDLEQAKVGKGVIVIFDRYPNEQISGKVMEISRIGTPKQNATYYDVTIAIETNLEILPGMNAVAYFD